MSQDDGRILRAVDRLLTIEEAAEGLNLKVSNVRALIRAGEIATIRVGKRMFVDEQSCLNMIARRLAAAEVEAEQKREARREAALARKQEVEGA